MEYNWSDPKKNTKINNIMMSKTEMSRKKRLGSVTSTLSNQLHPATQKKLESKKKKQTGGNATTGLEKEMEHFQFFDSYTTSSNNNNNDPFEESKTIKHILKKQASFPAENPASTATFVPPKLPTINAKSQKSLFGSRSDSKLRPNEGRRGGGNLDKTSKDSSLLSSRSNPDLFAPRRPDLISQDNALDLYEGLAGDQDEDRYSQDESFGAEASPEAKIQQRIDRIRTCPPHLGGVSSILDEVDQQQKYVEEQEKKAKKSKKKVETSSSTSTINTAACDFDLTKKFEKFKQMLKSNQTTSTTTLDSTGSNKHKDTNSTMSHAERRLKVSLPKKTTVAPVVPVALDGDDDDNDNEDDDDSTVKKTTKKKSSSHSTAVTVPIEKAPVVRSKKEIKIRNGVSLSDLKEEHKAALEILQELGGQMDLDALAAEHESFLHDKAKLKARHSDGIPPPAVISKCKSSKNVAAVSPKVTATTTTTTIAVPVIDLSSNTNSSSLVTKLRTAIPSGRDKIVEGDESVKDMSARSSSSSRPSTSSKLSTSSRPSSSTSQRVSSANMSARKSSRQVMEDDNVHIPRPAGKDLISAALNAANEFLMYEEVVATGDQKNQVELEQEEPKMKPFELDLDGISWHKKCEQVQEKMSEEETRNNSSLEEDQVAPMSQLYGEKGVQEQEEAEGFEENA